MSYSSKADNRLKHGARAIELLAANIALSPESCWGIAHAVIDLAMRLPADGKYLLVREAGKPVVRLYGVPADAFDEDEDEEDEDGA